MDEITARAQTTVLAPPDVVFDAIVTAATVTSYFPDRATGDIVEGADVQWAFDHADAVVDIHVTEVSRPCCVRFTWNAAQVGFKPVTFTLSPRGTATRVEVTEGGHPLSAAGAAKAVQQTGGWAEFLNYLKARLQFDIELRAGRQG